MAGIFYYDVVLNRLKINFKLSSIEKNIMFIILFYFFFIQFNVPFKIISLIETSQSVGGAKREYPGKTT